MRSRILRVPALSFVLTACCMTGNHHGEQKQDMGNPPAAAMAHHENMWASVNTAVAVIYPTKGNSVSGAITFTKTGDASVHIHGTITGLEPNSTHAFHIHEFGDSSAPDGMSAGGHFNPEGHKHGGPDAPEHHAGDLGNLTADATGTATIDLEVPGISIAGLKDPIIGRGVVIHAKPDDLVSQPVGNAGGRIGVGVIGIAKPSSK